MDPLTAIAIVALVRGILDKISSCLGCKDNIAQNKRKSKRLLGLLEALMPSLETIKKEEGRMIAHEETLNKLLEVVKRAEELLDKQKSKESRIKRLLKSEAVKKEFDDIAEGLKGHVLALELSVTVLAGQDASRREEDARKDMNDLKEDLKEDARKDMNDLKEELSDMMQNQQEELMEQLNAEGTEERDKAQEMLKNIFAAGNDQLRRDISDDIKQLLSISTLESRANVSFPEIDMTNLTPPEDEGRDDVILGSGSFGIVRKMRWIHGGGIDVAVKSLLQRRPNPKALAELKTEATAMHMMRHPNIVQLYGASLTPEVCLVLELATHGSLADMLEKDGAPTEPSMWMERLTFAVEIAKGLTYLHEVCKVLHRDVKSGNVLLFDGGSGRVAKLSDFGFAFVKADASAQSTLAVDATAGGTINWKAPELFDSKGKHMRPSDVYSFACVQYELASGTVPWAGQGLAQIVGEVIQGRRPDKPDGCDDALWNLIKRGWAQKPEERIKLAELSEQLESIRRAYAVEVHQPVDSTTSDDLSARLLDAVNTGNEAAVKALVAAGADVKKARKGGWMDGWTPLYNAARKGHDMVVKALVAAGADVNQAVNNGETPLYIAATEGHEAVVKALVAAGADVNKADDYGITPLFEAAYFGNEAGDEAVVEALVAAGADVNKARKYDGATPLFVAAQNDHVAVVKALVAARADVNQADEDGATPLFIAVCLGHEAVVKAMVAAGADVNQAVNNGETPLHVAAGKDHEAMVKALVAAGADVNKANKCGWTPLFVATMNGHVAVVKALVAAGADVNQAADVNRRVNRGETPLYVAVCLGYEAVVKALVAAGADVNQAVNNGETPLYVAVCLGHEAVVKALVAAGADVNQAVNNGETPLYVAAWSEAMVKALVAAERRPQSPPDYLTLTPEMPDEGARLRDAARNGNLNLVRQLITAKVNVNYDEDGGETALFEASRNGHRDVVRTLLKAGANKEGGILPDGATPLYVAAQIGHDEVVKVLLEAEAEKDMTVDGGMTPLFVAAMNGFHLVVKVLVEAGANVTKADNEGRTPLYIAAEENNVSVVRMLAYDQVARNMKSTRNKWTPLQVAECKNHQDVVNVLRRSI